MRLHRNLFYTPDRHVPAGRPATHPTLGSGSSTLRPASRTLSAVTAKYLQSYVNEYTFRYNHRKDEIAMFRTMLCRVNASRDGTPS